MWIFSEQQETSLQMFRWSNEIKSNIMEYTLPEGVTSPFAGKSDTEKTSTAVFNVLSNIIKHENQ